MTLINAEPLPIEDERQILRLYALYCHTFNHGDAQDFVDLFTPEAGFVKLNTGVKEFGSLGTPKGDAHGHAELLDLALGRRELFKGLVRHQQTDMVICSGESEDVAWGKSFILVTDWRDGPGRLAAVGDCTASFARTSAGWRFSRIELSTLPRPGAVANSSPGND
ncbi:nuclear transport factor 2 family protein [Pelagibacterium lacus]|uniref:Nuclear transport factor 2 family protein n=1 Tax=Pelagibacterium lacus TaxID=2282655 RepID=A0A369W3N4_9HYPH|nr:nuclear transport factor 2 family protein [Pelagibacterium lacus]RDE07882.1 nuclear transport factor 2 family protein [Pelagibacterium lacus]